MARMLRRLGSASIRRSTTSKLFATRDFRLLAAATLLYCCGIGAYQMLYSLFLLDRGFGERSIGLLSSASLLGTLAGTLPVGLLAGKFGARRAAAFCIAMMCMLGAIKLFMPSLAAQFVLDLLSGAFLCGWPIGLPPLVASITSEVRRSTAFSILFSIAILAAAGAGFIGGRLPGWCQLAAAGRHVPLNALGAKQWAMLAFCAFIVAAAIPLLRMGSNERYERVSSPRIVNTFVNAFLWRYLAVNACWGLAIGFFNPFTGVFLSRRMSLSLPHLGTFFSATQLLEALAVLASPWLLRRMSLVSGIAATQLTSAIALLVLATTHSWLQAVVPMIAYMLAQHVVDPNMQTLLMNGVDPGQRSSAAAMGVFTVSLAQAVAGTVSGTVISRFGYPMMFVVAAGLAICAAGTFRFFFGARISEAPALAVEPLQVVSTYRP
jgi:MFS family permease